MTVTMAIRLNAATSRNTRRGLPWSMIAPKTSGETMPPILKPVVTKPNTLPNEPGGVIVAYDHVARGHDHAVEKAGSRHCRYQQVWSRNRYWRSAR